MTLEINKIKEWVERFKPYFNNLLDDAIKRGENKLTMETFYPYLKETESAIEKHIHKMFKDYLMFLDYNIVEEETNDNKITISWE